MNRRLWATMGVAAAFLGLTASPALAEGDETLGPAGITLAEGTGFAIGGVGMFNTGSGTISVEVPAGATVKQVLLYWDGQTSGTNTPDSTAVVDGSDVTGEPLSSAPIPFFEQQDLPVSASAYRADITDLGVIAPGANSVDVSGLDFQRNGKNITNGAGILVVYDDGSGPKDLEVLDGVDTAFAGFPSPRDTTVPQTYTFEADTVDREATFYAFASSVFDATPVRPNALKITVDGVDTVITNPFTSAQGREYDAFEVPITIPAGATSVTIQALSGPDDGSGNKPASLTWTMGALAVPPVTPTTTTTTTPVETTTTLPAETTTTLPEETTSTTSSQVETTTTVPPTTTTTSGDLPKTGNNTMPLVFAGLGLVLVGGATVLGVRRFRGA